MISMFVWTVKNYLKILYERWFFSDFYLFKAFGKSLQEKSVLQVKDMIWVFLMA